MIEIRLPFQKTKPEKNISPDSFTPNHRADFIASLPKSKEATQAWLGSLEHELLKPVGQRDRLIVGNCLFVLAYYLTSNDRLARMYEDWHEGIARNLELYGDIASFDAFIEKNLLDLDYISGDSSDVWYVPGGSGIVRLGFEFMSGRLLITNLDFFPDKDKLHAVSIRCSLACDHLHNN